MRRYPLILLCLLGLCPKAGADAGLAESRPLVWIVDGAGDLKGCSNALAQANLAEDTPFELVVFPWSHGHRRLLLDQIDHNHAKQKGALLAARILDVRRTQGDRRMVVVAHSAGCAVALAACAHLPAGSIDRLVLLAPSVSSGYDLRPVVPAPREGIDVFCSEKDRIALGLVMKVVRTTDTLRSSMAAGRYGFQPKKDAPLSDSEWARVRHHFWTPELAWTGHNGRHHGMHSPAFVKHFVFPLLSGPPEAGAVSSGSLMRRAGP